MAIRKIDSYILNSGNINYIHAEKQLLFLIVYKGSDELRLSFLMKKIFKIRSKNRKFR